jgi:hypothetical protein
VKSRLINKFYSIISLTIIKLYAILMIMSRKEKMYRTAQERHEDERRRTFQMRRLGVTVVAASVALVGSLIGVEVVGGGDPFSPPITHGVFNPNLKVTFTEGATLRTSAERTTDPLGDVSSQNALPYTWTQSKRDHNRSYY